MRIARAEKPANVRRGYRNRAYDEISYRRCVTEHVQIVQRDDGPLLTQMLCEPFAQNEGRPRTAIRRRGGGRETDPQRRYRRRECVDEAAHEGDEFCVRAAGAKVNATRAHAFQHERDRFSFSRTGGSAEKRHPVGVRGPEPREQLRAHFVGAKAPTPHGTPLPVGPL